MKVKFLISGIILALVLSSFCTNCPKGKVPISITVKKIESYRKVVKSINWVGWDDLPELLHHKPKKILVQIGTSWCGWCKRMEYVTMQQPEIVDLLNKHFYCIKLDGEATEPVYFDGKTYQFNPNYAKRRNGAHQLAVELLSNHIVYPSTVVFTPQYKKIKVHRGSATEQNFVNLLHQVLNQ